MITAFYAALTVLAANAPAPTPAPKPPPTPGPAVHHILILDDSGSMESDFDPQGYGLAVPAIYDAVLGASRLSAFLLAQQFPGGPVPRLGPADYLEYPRENGTFYAKSIRAALTEAEAQPPTTRVEIALVTDAEPTDPAAKRALDQALASHPNVRFRCVQLGTSDPGDLCTASTFARDGFELARVMTEALANSLGSISRWGKAKPGETIDLGTFGPYVKRAHVLLLGARAGDDFSAEVLAGDGQRHPLTTRYTRPVVAQADLAALIAQIGRSNARGRMPGGLQERRLVLATLRLEALPASDKPWQLRLGKADGPVAWGLILEYDLTAAISAPPAISADAKYFEVRSDLGHAGAHLGDPKAIAALGFVPKLIATPHCAPTSKVRCPDPMTFAMTVASDGYASVRVPADPTTPIASWSLRVDWIAPTADLASPTATTVRESLGRADVAVTPTPPPPLTPPPSTTPSPSPSPAPPPTPPSAAAPPPPTTATLPIQRWIPPVLDVPNWTIEHSDFAYTMTVQSSDGHRLKGAEIDAEKLSAALVVDGAEQPMKRVGDAFAATLAAGAPGTRKVQIRLRYPGGEVTSNDDAMDVLPDAAVRLAPRTDFGAVDAGCDALARCEALELSKSRRLDAVDLRARRLPGAFESLQVTLRRGEWSHVLTREEAVTIPRAADPAAALEVCWAPPGCDDAPDDPHEVLALEPADPRLQTPDRQAETRLVATVVPATWLHCNLWWVLIVGGTFLFFLIAWGYVRPHAFPAGAMVQVADHERRLARDPGRPLRVVPCGRRGFYRTATCAFDGSGFTVKKTRPHVVLLRADRGAQIALVPRGATLERRQRGAWVPIDRSVERHIMAGAIYRVNQSFFFKVMA